MARPKRDPLIAAMIAKLPDAGPWPVDDRTAWLRLMEMAFDAVYGGSAGGSMAAAQPFKPVVKAAPAYPFYIDTDGKAKNKAGKPVNAKDVKGELFDLRGQDGDVKAIEWADGSTGLNGADLTIVAV